jgi:phage-related protein
MREHTTQRLAALVDQKTRLKRALWPLSKTNKKIFKSTWRWQEAVRGTVTPFIL